MYDYQRRRTAGQQRYHQAIVDCVAELDTIEDAVKAAHAKYEKLTDLLSRDPILRSKGNDGLKQLMRPMINAVKAVERVERAAKALGDSHEALNSAIERYAPKDDNPWAR